MISKPRTVKTVYDKYDDDLYKTEKYIQKCPLCQEEMNTSEHLYACRCEAASAIVIVADLEQKRISIPQELYEVTGISSFQLDHLRRTIIRNINIDSRTRIGMFDQLQQAEIVDAIPGIDGRDDAVIIFGAISRFLVQLLQPSISATLGLIDLRNKKKVELERSLPQREAAERKTRKHESRNPFDFGFPEEPLYVDPIPVSSYEIRYGSPSVVAQILARTPEDALNAVSRLTQILPSCIEIYSSSEVHPGTYVLSVDGMSTQRVNYISKASSAFSPMLSLSERLSGVLEGFCKYRIMRQPALHDEAEDKFKNFVVRLERLIHAGHLFRFRDFILRCSEHAEEADNRIILRDIQAVQTSVLHKETLTGEQLHGTLIWLPVAESLRIVVKYAASSGITSGFSSEQMFNIDRSLPIGVKRPRSMPYHSKKIVVDHSTAPQNSRTPIKRRCKTQHPHRAVAVHNKIKDCLLFHGDTQQQSPRISTFAEIPPPPHQSSCDELASFQANVDTLQQQYMQVSQQKVDVRDSEMCQQIISDSESLLTDDRLLSLSASHKKFLREKLKRAIIQVRTIQQEASAYDSSQLPNANKLNFALLQPGPANLT
jgi:hypothetical protein